AETDGADVSVVAGVYFLLTDRFQLNLLLTRISQLPRDDRWKTLARMALRYDLYGALAALTTKVIEATSPELSATERVDQWQRDNETTLQRVRNSMEEFVDMDADLAVLSVLLRQVRTLVQSSAARMKKS